MKTSKVKIVAKRPKTGMTQLLEALTPGSNECVVLESAQEHRNHSGPTAYLANTKGMKFKTANGENGTVNVWRIK